jgi:hypothetical protein
MARERLESATATKRLSSAGSTDPVTGQTATHRAADNQQNQARQQHRTNGISGEGQTARRRGRHSLAGKDVCASPARRNPTLAGASAAALAPIATLAPTAPLPPILRDGSVAAPGSTRCCQSAPSVHKQREGEKKDRDESHRGAI